MTEELPGHGYLLAKSPVVHLCGQQRLQNTLHSVVKARGASSKVLAGGLNGLGIVLLTGW